MTEIDSKKFRELYTKVKNHVMDTNFFVGERLGFGSYSYADIDLYVGPREPITPLSYASLNDFLRILSPEGLEPETLLQFRHPFKQTTNEEDFDPSLLSYGVLGFQVPIFEEHSIEKVQTVEQHPRGEVWATGEFIAPMDQMKGIFTGKYRTRDEFFQALEQGSIQRSRILYGGVRVRAFPNPEIAQDAYDGKTDLYGRIVPKESLK